MTKSKVLLLVLAIVLVGSIPLIIFYKVSVENNSISGINSTMPSFNMYSDGNKLIYNYNRNLYLYNCKSGQNELLSSNIGPERLMNFAYHDRIAYFPGKNNELLAYHLDTKTEQSEYQFDCDFEILDINEDNLIIIKTNRNKAGELIDSDIILFSIVKKEIKELFKSDDFFLDLKINKNYLFYINSHRNNENNDALMSVNLSDGKSRELVLMHHIESIVQCDEDSLIISASADSNQENFWRANLNGSNTKFGDITFPAEGYLKGITEYDDKIYYGRTDESAVFCLDENGKSTKICNAYGDKISVCSEGVYIYNAFDKLRFFSFSGKDYRDISIK